MDNSKRIRIFYSLARIIIIPAVLAMVFCLSACEELSSSSGGRPGLFPSVEPANTSSLGQSSIPDGSAITDTLNTPEEDPEDFSADPADIIISVESISIDLDSTEAVKGETLVPLVTVLPSDATDGTYTLSSSDETVLRPTDDGFEADGGGTADIIAMASNGLTARISITVTVPVESVTLEAEQLTVSRGETVTLSPVIHPADATDATVVYSSSDESVAAVGGDGTVRALAAGTAVIECAVGDVSVSVEVIVTVPASSISVSADRRIYAVGSQGSFAVQISPQDTTDTDFTVSISGGAELTGENTFSCVSGGEATITVTTENGMTARFTVNIIDLSVFAAEVFDLTNAERESAGLQPLSRMAALTLAAEVRASEIIESFSHTRPDGRSCFTAFDESNVSYRWAGENLAMGQRTPAEVVRGWMESPGHRENILTAEFGHLGIGVAMDASGRLYWTQTFTD